MIRLAVLSGVGAVVGLVAVLACCLCCLLCRCLYCLLWADEARERGAAQRHATPQRQHGKPHGAVSSTKQRPAKGRRHGRGGRGEAGNEAGGDEDVQGDGDGSPSPASAGARRRSSAVMLWLPGNSVGGGRRASNRVSPAAKSPRAEDRQSMLAAAVPPPPPPGMAMGDETLPEGWEQYVDDYGATYYHHPSRGSTWVRPSAVC